MFKPNQSKVQFIVYLVRWNTMVFFEEDEEWEEGEEEEWEEEEW